MIIIIIIFFLQIEISFYKYSMILFMIDFLEKLGS
jgi:hypothetical protein